jgi:flagellar hook-length control protein FliK
LIQKVIPDLLPRELGGTKSPPGIAPKSDRKTGEGGGKPTEFAELMMGSDRTERKESKPGRESEGKRSRDSESEPARKLNQKQTQKKPAVLKKDSRAAKTTEDAQEMTSQANVATSPLPVSQASPIRNEIQGEEVEEVISIDEASAPISAELQALVEKRNEAVESRQDAMTDFMEKMQTDFGVSPEKIVEAFSQMSEEAMSAPPEESAKDFLAALELPQEKMASAENLYSELLASVKDADLGEKIATMDATLQALDETLDEVTDIPGFSQMSLKDQTLAQLSQAADKLSEALVQSPMAPLAPFEAQRAADDMNARLAQLVRETKTEDSESAAPIALAATGPEAKTASAVVAPGVAVTQMSAANAGQPSFRNGAGGQSSKESQFVSEAKKESKVGEVSSESLTPSLEATPMPLTSAPAAPTFSVTSASPTTVALAQPMTADEEAANMKDVLGQATIALKNGGGEIQMDLKPEGVGKVRLKVSVEDGQVNIQMLTENETAKKMLEKGLGELKSSLAEHQLKVENLKVDVGAEIKKHMDQNSDSGREQARQTAQDFMGRFHDERNSFRQNFMGSSGFRRSYGGGNRPEMNADTSDRVVASGSAAARGSNGSSKRLNLVA